MTAEWVELGRLGRPKGLKGWQHLESWTDPPEALFEYEAWHLVGPAGRVLARCAEARASGQGFEARLEGVTTREAAEQHVGLRIEVPRAALPPAAEGEHYRVDLIGCTVRNLEGVELGVLERFEDFPANPVMVVRGDRERWLPVTPQHLRQIDAVARCVTVDWPAEF